MKRLHMIPIWLLLFAFSINAAMAETKYIRTIVRITLRTGPGSDNKIISMIKSGDPIELLESTGQWSKIRTIEGKEGWILSNLITAEKPSQYVPLSRASEAIPSEQQSAILAENKALEAENVRLKTALSKSEKELAQNRVSLEELKTVSADYDKVIAELSEQTEKAKDDESQKLDPRLKQNMWWFLLGAAIILIGYIIGYNVKRPRSRPLLR